jgi:hypothetical protein
MYIKPREIIKTLIKVPILNGDTMLELKREREGNSLF